MTAPTPRVTCRLAEPVSDLAVTDIAHGQEELTVRLHSPSDPTLWVRIALPLHLPEAGKRTCLLVAETDTFCHPCRLPIRQGHLCTLFEGRLNCGKC